MPKANRSRKAQKNIEADGFASDDPTVIPSEEDRIRVPEFQVNRQRDPQGSVSDSESETLVVPKKRCVVYVQDTDLFRECHSLYTVLSS